MQYFILKNDMIWMYKDVDYDAVLRKVFQGNVVSIGWIAVLNEGVFFATLYKLMWDIICDVLL